MVAKTVKLFAAHGEHVPQYLGNNCIVCLAFGVVDGKTLVVLGSDELEVTNLPPACSDEFEVFRSKPDFSEAVTINSNEFK